MPGTDMADSAGAKTAPAEQQVAHLNELVLVGRLTSVAQELVLPSGTVVSKFRVAAARPAGAGRVGVDALDCAAWEPDLRAAVAEWPVGAVVEVRGAVRRRFRRGPEGPVSRWEVEVRGVRLREPSG